MYLLGVYSVQGPGLGRAWEKLGSLSHRAYPVVGEVDIKPVNELIIYHHEQLIITIRGSMGEGFPEGCLC